ncbi:MAG: SRPBCC family protein [Pseudomonadota bacterium]
MDRRVFMALVLLTGAAPATAAEIREVTVEHEGKRYTMRSETWFDAPRAGVFDVLTDYAQFDRISSVYDETRFEAPAEDGTPRVYTRVKGCVLFFCQTMARTERLENEGLGSIRTTQEPGGEDFRHAVATWALSEEDDGTLVVYEIEMEPAFWVPPVIGPYVMKRQLIKGGRDAVARIEKLAQASMADASTFRERGLTGFDDPQ